MEIALLRDGGIVDQERIVRVGGDTAERGSPAADFVGAVPGRVDVVVINAAKGPLGKLDVTVDEQDVLSIAMMGQGIAF